MKGDIILIIKENIEIFLRAYGGVIIALRTFVEIVVELLCCAGLLPMVRALGCSVWQVSGLLIASLLSL